MNDNMSIFLATTILALGGLGLYMFKSSDDTSSHSDEDIEDYDEDGLFGSGSFFNWGSKSDSDDKTDELDELNEIDEEEYKPKKRASKTQKNRKSNGTSKRRY